MKITIPTLNGIRLEVDAEVTGEWSYHRDPFERRGWTVTHVPTGLKIPRNMSSIVAKRLVKRLALEVPTLPIKPRHWDKQPTEDDLGEAYQEPLAKMVAIVNAETGR